MNVASFNLGKIKGEKGERGIAGEKGERGDRGERGQSGYTPVFSVEETVTLNPEESAYVSLDSTDIQNPKIKFFIPKGKNGSDAHGDMQKNVYDPNGKSEDIYEFAQNCAKDKMSKTGGFFLGKVRAYNSNEESCIRNISIGEGFPTEADNGDIHILESKKSDLKIGDLSVGSKISIKENGKSVPYILVHKNYHHEDSVVLVREKLFNANVVFDKQNKSSYHQSDADIYLNSVVLNSYDDAEKLQEVALENENIKRKIFLMSKDEFNAFDYFKNNSKIAYDEKDNARAYMLRTQYNESNIYVVNFDGQIISARAQYGSFVRPAIVLSGSLKVENVGYSDAFAYEISDEWAKIFVYQDGAWKECGRV